MRGILVFLLIFLLAGAAARAADFIAGPIAVTPVRVVDGDTFVGDALIWPGHHLRVVIRIRGVDAPRPPGADRPESR